MVVSERSQRRRKRRARTNCHHAVLEPRTRAPPDRSTNSAPHRCAHTDCVSLHGRGQRWTAIRLRRPSPERLRLGELHQASADALAANRRDPGERYRVDRVRRRPPRISTSLPARRGHRHRQTVRQGICVPLLALWSGAAKEQATRRRDQPGSLPSSLQADRAGRCMSRASKLVSPCPPSISGLAGMRSSPTVRRVPQLRPGASPVLFVPSEGGQGRWNCSVLGTTSPHQRRLTPASGAEDHDQPLPGPARMPRRSLRVGADQHRPAATDAPTTPHPPPQPPARRLLSPTRDRI